MRTVFLLLALLSGACWADRAHLLIQKSLLTNRAFAGKDIPIRYRIFNVGSSAAFDVTLEDEWSPEEFEPISGLHSGSWAKIPAGANISHIVVVRPYSYGYKSSAAAKVTYRASADSDEVQVAYSNDLGVLPVASNKDDDKLSDPHAWLVFLVFGVALAFMQIHLQHSALQPWNGAAGLEWLAFLIFAAALAFIPLILCRPPATQDAASKKAKKA